jgi:23S rRNA (uridine2552-2'-O)-methyltransferase
MNRLYKDILRTRNVHTCRALSKEAPHSLKNKKHSSQLWLKRQLRDPYVELAKQENYRCRSAFKLLQINERHKILRPGLTIVDCGAAPGSWTQVAVNMSNARGQSSDPRSPVGKVYAIDKLPFYPVDGATILGNMDFTNAKTQETLLRLLQGNKVDVVLSDMAPNATGVRELDHDNIILLAYAVTKLALRISRVDGTLVIKVWDGGKSYQLEQDLSRFYHSVKVIKPDATRDESTEKFILARGFRGIKTPR